jgi:hypothetical protein
LVSSHEFGHYPVPYPSPVELEEAPNIPTALPTENNEISFNRQKFPERDQRITLSDLENIFNRNN